MRRAASSQDRQKIPSVAAATHRDASLARVATGFTGVISSRRAQVVRHDGRHYAAERISRPVPFEQGRVQQMGKKLGSFNEPRSRAGKIGVRIHRIDSGVAHRRKPPRPDVETADRALGLQIQVLNAKTSREIDAAFVSPWRHSRASARAAVSL
jgi:hypothetical protein